MRRIVSIATVVLAFLLPHEVGAQEVKGEDEILEFKAHGLVAFEAGQIVSGVRNEGTNMLPIDHIWQERLLLRIGGQVDLGERFTASFLAQGNLAFSYPMDNANKDKNSLSARKIFFPLEGQGSYSIGNVNSPFLKIALGFFPFKYNQDVRNLGEFMFRTSTYPLYFNNEFDFPRARLLGLRLTSDIKVNEILSSIHAEGLFFSELDFYPAQNWGLAAIASVKLFNILEIGGGITGNNLFSVYGNANKTGFEFLDLVTPKSDLNKYLDTNNITMRVDTQYSFPDTNYDTAIAGYYTFRGSKAMVRLALDPKPLIPLSIFGENDLRLYAEMCIVGLKNYPYQYEKPICRMPIAFGFNFPGFKIVDLINIELEYLNTGNKLLSSFWVLEDRIPKPLETTEATYKRNPWKWSIFIEKRFMKHIAFKFQLARDHIVPKAYNADYEERGESLFRKGDWAWMMKSEFSF
jgi:hypothetical protein